METLIGQGDMGKETWNMEHGTWTWRHGHMVMETRRWSHGHGDTEMVTWSWRHGDGDGHMVMETRRWTHGSYGHMDAWRHGDIEFLKNQMENGSPDEFP
jgi:hypothetical protein